MRNLRRYRNLKRYPARLKRLLRRSGPPPAPSSSPDTLVLRYGPTVPIADRFAALAGRGQPRKIVDVRHGTGRRRRTDFVMLFPLLAPGGTYVFEDTSPVLDLLRDLTALNEGTPVPGAGAVMEELAASTSAVRFEGTGATVTKRLAHQFKLRDGVANDVLTRRFGDRWGAVVLSRPPVTYESKSRVFVHGEADPPLRTPEIIDVPARFLRRYDGVQCWPRQRVRYGEYWLPDTFRHPLRENLAHRALISPSKYAGRLRDGAPGPTRAVSGPVFFLDTEYPGHFGHVLTEVVARWWGWKEAVARVPGIRPLVSLDEKMDAIPGFQRQIFAAMGIEVDSIEYVRWGECVAVETLYAATPDFAMPVYASPDLAEVWDTIRRECEVREPVPTPKRIFIARRPMGIRTCFNAAEVEAMFARLGFEIVYPEDRTFSEQVTLFSRADVIAGFGGSGMFNAMFRPGATIIVLAAAAYTATNEYLISSVVGGTLQYFRSASIPPKPREGRIWYPFQANFTFDVARFEPEIAEILERS